MKISTILLLFLIHTLAKSQCVITGRVAKDVKKISYFKPFDGFGNFEILTKGQVDNDGNFVIILNVKQPTTTKFFFGNEVVWLLIQPEDSINLEITSSDGKPNGKRWLKVTGENAAGYEYYNQVYNFWPITKFYGVRDIFKFRKIDDATELIKNINYEMNNQTRWIDSLNRQGLITDLYSKYIRLEINALICSEVLILCNKYCSEKVRYSIEKEVFSMVDITNPLLKTCTFAKSYYDTFYEAKYRYFNNKLDTSQVVIDEIPYLVLAPEDLKPFLWGTNLIAYLTMVPDQYNYCQLTKKYIKISEILPTPIT